MGGVKPRHASGQSDGQSLKGEKDQRKTQYRAAAKASGGPIVKQHHGKLQRGHKAAEHTHAARIAAHMTYHIDEKIVY